MTIVYENVEVQGSLGGGGTHASAKLDSVSVTDTVKVFVAVSWSNDVSVWCHVQVGIISSAVSPSRTSVPWFLSIGPAPRDPMRPTEMIPVVALYVTGFREPISAAGAKPQPSDATVP